LNVKRIFQAVFFSVWLLSISFINAQELAHNHPELKWYTIETKHFLVHYHKGAERTAKATAKIAEDIYWPVTSLYLYEPDEKVQFIIRDHDDYSNGAAYYYDNKIELWATPMDFILRGTHNWLRNVITHEFSHMISLGAARKMPRTLPALYFQYFGYEPEKNPYVLRGFPNQVLSYPLTGVVIPMWLAEGVAQFQIPALNYDSWDTHRDMILRTATLENSLLDRKEMGVFGDTSIRNEMSYNQGYSMTQYIVDRYGLETLRKIMKEMKAPWRLTIDGALQKVIKLSEKELYKEWKDYLEKMYAFRTESIKNNLITGVNIHKESSANLFPQWSPTGKSYVFLSNKKSESIYRTALYYHKTTGKTEKIMDGVQSSVSWSPDGEKIAYTKYTSPNKYFSNYLDIYVYDLKKKKERPITKYYRAQSPDWRPDGNEILFVVTKDGTQNIATVHLETKQLTNLTDYKNGEQVFSPRWSPDGKWIVFSLSKRNDRDIALLEVDTKDIKLLLRDKTDARDPVFSPDGQRLYFSWDRTGIFNIYRMGLDGKNVEQLTNVLGGAFMPSINQKGQLLYCHFQTLKYNIAKIDKPESVDKIKTEYVEYTQNVHLASTSLHEILPLNENKADITTNKYDDTQLPNYQSKPYHQVYSKISFLPRVMIDYKTTKLGTYFYSSDALNKYSILGGVTANKDWDLDVFGIVEYNRFLPTIFLEAYYQTRHHSQMDSLIIQDKYVDYRDYTKFAYNYNLMEVDLGLKSYLFNEMNNVRLAFIFSRYSAKVKYEIENQKSTNAYTYFIGKNFSLTYNFANFVESPWFDSEINPYGKRKISITVNQEFDSFIDSFKVTEYGTWGEVYDEYNFTKLELNWREYIRVFPFAKHTLDFQLQAGAITQPVHEFFNFFSGGLLGLRGYPYYSIEGRKQIITRTAYRFPVINHLNFRLLHLYFDKLYAGVFYDFGNAFDEDKIDFKKFKSDYGVELRLNLTSFYSMPTRIFFNAAYGTDEFIKTESYSDIQLKYGKEWRYYFGVTFGFFN